ncbi:unnamed protein product [Symbiodinium natans]|uniref:Secreted protein n=1 Tax=Symbiodinium natans TaxID=878477 RepID=A0A812TNE4_9DINO|nr:unnamed protein product [Symbiodinium natans]
MFLLISMQPGWPLISMMFLLSCHLPRMAVQQGDVLKARVHSHLLVSCEPAAPGGVIKSGLEQWKEATARRLATQNTYVVVCLHWMHAGGSGMLKTADAY